MAYLGGGGVPGGGGCTVVVLISEAVTWDGLGGGVRSLLVIFNFLILFSKLKKKRNKKEKKKEKRKKKKEKNLYSGVRDFRSPVATPGGQGPGYIGAAGPYGLCTAPRLWGPLSRRGGVPWGWGLAGGGLGTYADRVRMTRGGLGLGSQNCLPALGKIQKRKKEKQSQEPHLHKKHTQKF